MNHSIRILHCTGVTPSWYTNTTVNYVTAVSISIFAIISAVFSSVANALVIIVFVRKRLLHLPLNILLVNMCFIDFVVGTVVQPLFAALRITELHFKELCFLKQITAILGYFCGGMTICTLCLISLDRWIAITMPFRYESMVTRKLCLALLSMAYIVCMGMVLLRNFGFLSTNVYYLMVSLFLIILTIQAIFCYTKIYKIARSHERRIDSTKRITQTMTTLSSNGNQAFTKATAGEEASARGKAIRTLSERRKSKTVVYMAVLLVICYLPKALVMLDSFLFRKRDSLSYATLKWSETLFLLNSTFNPVIYCLRMAYIRSEIWKMLETLSRKLAS